jgi:hypothetical protein
MQTVRICSTLPLKTRNPLVTSGMAETLEELRRLNDVVCPATPALRRSGTPFCLLGQKMRIASPPPRLDR